MEQIATSIGLEMLCATCYIEKNASINGWHFLNDHGACVALYGLSVAPPLWYQRLRQALLDDGFTQSKYDECVFLKENMMVFLWVDDCGIIAPTMDVINQFVERLKTRGFKLSVDSDFAEYLGIHFTRKDGTITMTQPRLIKKIVEATGMTNCNGNFVPASQVCLGSDPDSPLMKEK